MGAERTTGLEWADVITSGGMGGASGDKISETGRSENAIKDSRVLGISISRGGSSD